MLLALPWVLDRIDLWDNPFGSETVDRSGPALLKSIEDIGEYRAATGHFEQIVDIERDVRFVPAAIKGERVLFVAVGSVDAGVDFAQLGEDAIVVSDDRTEVELTLPPIRFFEATVDPELSYVYDRDRGIIDRVGSLVSEDANDERDLYLLAAKKLAAAARGGSGLAQRAERNTRAMLESLLRGLGFERVTIRFA